MLVEKGSAVAGDPFVSSVKVIDQHIEVNLAGRVALRCGTGLERKPLAVRRGLKRDPPWVPLDRNTAEQPRPESRQVPRPGAVQDHLADPSDGGFLAHLGMMTCPDLPTPRERPDLPPTARMPACVA